MTEYKVFVGELSYTIKADNFELAEYLKFFLEKRTVAVFTKFDCFCEVILKKMDAC